MRTSRFLFLGIGVVAACNTSQHSTPTPIPAPLRATFDIGIPEPSHPMPSPSPLGTTARPPCLHSAQFTGVVVPGGSDARVLLGRAFVNVERHNDKQFDALILRVEVASPAHQLGGGNTVEYRLAPTVDSAGPSITTWQPQDTVRLLVPWDQGSGDRRLLFFLNYRTIAHDGTMSGCSVVLRSGVLRF